MPLSDRVVFPDWADRVQHDYPFEDGVHGTFEIEIEAKTPVFVRGRQDKFFRTPAGEFAIPGSSIRGMLRNVAEIAWFSKMQRVNDHRYGVRDLHHRKLYGEHMALIHEGQPVPLVSSGWLQRVEDEAGIAARIVPCSFAKVEYALLQELARKRGIHRFDPGKPQSSVQKYRAWQKGTADLDTRAEVRILMRHNPPGKPPRLGSYGVVRSLGDGPEQGRLVFTGQPSRYVPARAKSPGSGNPKHHDFFFFAEREDECLDVTREAMRDFEFVHRDRAEQHGLEVAPNVEWGYWKPRFERGERVPVFFLLDAEGKLRAFGLAMMFRLAYRWTTRDAVRNVSFDHLPARGDERLDLAELIFGTVPLEEGGSKAGRHRGMRGRISFGLARCEHGKEMDEVVEILAAPKASYYPAYLEQNPEKGPGEPPPKKARGAPDYKTYMDDGVRVRGWKRYRQRLAPAKGYVPPKADLSRVGTRFRPLGKGARFRGVVRVHNLREVELGAVLWVLDFGGDAHARHGLGLAKPFGYGAVTIRIRDASGLRRNRDGSPVDLDRARQAFVDYMEERFADRWGGWRHSQQIFELLTMARPVSESEAGDLRYMRLDHPEFGNEFVAAKKQGLVLAPAGGTERWAREVGLSGSPGRAKDSRRARASAPDPAASRPEVDRTDLDRKELIEKFRKGDYIEVLDRWRKEGGELEEARKRIAREVLENPPRKLKKKRPDLVEWVWGAGA